MANLLAELQQRQQTSVDVQPIPTGVQPSPGVGVNLLEELARQQAQPSTAQPDFPGAAVIEPARAIVSGLGRTIAGGLGAIPISLNPFAEEGAADAFIQELQAGTFQPTTEAGQAGLEVFTGLIEKGIDIVNFPISGLAGILELATLQGLDRAADTVEAIQSVGVSKTAGERVFEETGSPLAATLAETAPTAILSLIGAPGIAATGKATGAAGRAVVSAAPRIAETVVATAPKIAEAAVTTGKALAARAGATGEALRFQFQTATKKRIVEQIQKGSTDVETAKFKLAGSLEKPIAVTDSIAVGAIKQGFDEGVVAAVKGASQIDKTKMLEMVDIMKKGKENALFAQRNRPGDIAGDSLMNRFRIVSSANKTAGKELDGVAKALKGQRVDHTPAVAQFVDDLDSMGVSLIEVGGKVKPNFRGSIVEGLSGPEAVINRVVERMRANKNDIDAFELHRLKKFIDEQVTFGKKIEGLGGRTENILKSLRSGLDETLDTKFPEYNRVNNTFSETIRAIDSLQDVAGKKLNLVGPNADKATGTLLRRLMSNAQSRVRLLDAVDDIETVARKHAGTGKEVVPFGVFAKKPVSRIKIDDDILTQILFVDELDSVFGSVARTSFKGQIEQAVKQIPITPVQAGAVALRVAGKGIEKVRGINEKGAFEAINKLLGEK